MKFFIAGALMFGLTVSAFSRADTIGAGEISFHARSIAADGAMKILQGDVQIETSTIVIQAQRAVYNANTRDIDATGNVHITLKK